LREIFKMKFEIGSVKEHVLYWPPKPNIAPQVGWTDAQLRDCIWPRKIRDLWPNLLQFHCIYTWTWRYDPSNLVLWVM